MKNLCIIPARGGSKRIPGKNHKQFLGKPIIAYSIEAAIQSNLFDVIMVSTDDPMMAEIAVHYGAEIPFMRSKTNASDTATIAEVILEVLSTYADKGLHFDFGCCLFPTAPLTRSERLHQGYELLKSNKYTTVFPIVEYSTPILRSLSLSKDNKVEMNWPEHLLTRSQDLPTAYYDAGQFYWFKVSNFLDEPKLVSRNSGAIVLNSMEAQDIDNEADWKLAEIKFSLKKEC